MEDFFFFFFQISDSLDPGGSNPWGWEKPEKRQGYIDTWVLPSDHQNIRGIITIVIWSTSKVVIVSVYEKKTRMLEERHHIAWLGKGPLEKLKILLL